MTPALMPYHAQPNGERDTEGLRRLLCAIAAGPALRWARELALDAEDAAVVLGSEEP